MAPGIVLFQSNVLDRCPPFLDHQPSSKALLSTDPPFLVASLTRTSTLLLLLRLFSLLAGRFTRFHLFLSTIGPACLGPCCRVTSHLSCPFVFDCSPETSHPAEHDIFCSCILFAIVTLSLHCPLHHSKPRPKARTSRLCPPHTILSPSESTRLAVNISRNVLFGPVQTSAVHRHLYQ